MKNLYLFLCTTLLFSINNVFAQAKTKQFHFEKQATVNLSEIKTDYSPKLLVREMPKHSSEKVIQYPSATPQQKSAQSSSTLTPLVLGQSFAANQWGFSTPNDNDFAISDSGMMISVINTNIYVRNVHTASVAPYKSLAAWTTPINNNHQEFDPKVMYDPDADKFVLTCLVGFTDSTSKIIVGFSQTNNPAGNWNLYTLPGDPLNYNLWSDYPMIAMTKKELFLTINYLYNDSSWQTGFVETLVWQMKKDSGYVGNTLGTTLHYDIKYNNKPIRNLCPVKGGSQLYGPDMYFLSNRNLASQNDTVFLVNISDTIGAPTQTLTVKVLQSNPPYYFPPDGRQTFSTQTLASNDSRNLGAFIENNKIQYVHSTMNPTNSLVTVFYGVIDNPGAATPSITGYYLDNDTMDFAYPNISYAGNSASDNTSIISFDHASDKSFPGVAAIKADANGNFSPILRITDGTAAVNLLQSNLERWGDYSGSQRKYNNPGEVWMSGYIGSGYNFQYPNAHRAWVAQLGIAGVATTVNEKENSIQDALLYPNPTKDFFSVDLSLTQPEYLSFTLYDAQGKQVALLLRDWVKVKQNVFSFKTSDLSNGIYFLKITGNKGTNISKKVIVE